MSRKFNNLVGSAFGLAAYLSVGACLNAQHADFTTTEMGRFEQPWALEFLPDERLLVSEMVGGVRSVATRAPAYGGEMSGGFERCWTTPEN